jgi:hypothetical protein
MSWKLWLDDQLDEQLEDGTVIRPVPDGFIGAKSSAEAIELVDRFGFPDFMDLDHDLGGEDTAMALLKYMAYSCDDFPPSYRVHSRNPVGAANIDSYMKSWTKSMEE